jgi:oligopeptide/dipeptide ABC transporter ATP-binding protein
MLSMILQDPMTSLNPVFTVGNQVKEAIRTHSKLRGRSLVDKAREMLGLVRIPSPDLQLRNYPHQLSGGMRQRVAGAICISSAPRLLIADESTSSLDVTVQAQYLFLLKEIQQQTGMALIFVTHDLGIVRSVCDRVAVMYAGRVVETAKVKELFDRPAHPYTIALMKSVPKVEEEMKVLENIDGQPPSLYCLPKGCYFSPRCPDKHSEKCNSTTPPEVEVNDEHWVTCWQHA